jgi:hypothetical protein
MVMKCFGGTQKSTFRDESVLLKVLVFDVLFRSIVQEHKQ